MKDSLKPGIEFTHCFRISENKCVPALYPESEEFIAMPEVFATGYMVGFLEWACIKALNPHIDWPEEQSLGIHINVSHIAATPPGMEVTAKVRITEVDGRRIRFDVEAYDGQELISQGTHERMIVDRARFDEKISRKSQVG